MAREKGTETPRKARPTLGLTISLDPGVSTGFAIWRNVDKTLVRAGTCRPSLQVASWEDKCSATLENITAEMRLAGYLTQVAVVEMPAYFDDAGGRMAAVTGSVAKVLLFTGRIAQVCYERHIVFEPIYVRDWRGQMTDEAVKHRVQKRLGPEEADILEGKDVKGITGHTWDAVGLGLYYFGRLDVNAG